MKIFIWMINKKKKKRCLGFLYCHILNFLVLIVVFLNLLLDSNIYIEKKMSCKFIKLFNSRNFFLCLIAQANVIVEVDNNNLSSSNQYNCYS